MRQTGGVFADAVIRLPPLLLQSAEARRREAARAHERQEAEQGWQRERRAAMWQCVALSFSGIPLFGLGMYLEDGRWGEVMLAAAFFVSYAGPCARWLVFHLKSVDRNDC